MSIPLGMFHEDDHVSKAFTRLGMGFLLRRIRNYWIDSLPEGRNKSCQDYLKLSSSFLTPACD